MLSKFKNGFFWFLFAFCFFLFIFIIWAGVKIYLLKRLENNSSKGVPDSSTPLLPTELSLEPEMVDFPEKESEFLFPVGEEFLAEVIIDEERSQVLSVFLPAGSEVRAIFPGIVTKVLLNQKPFEDDVAFSEIVLEKDDGQYWTSYIIVGEVLVTEGEEVSGGQVLARVSEEKLAFRANTNLSLWIHDKNNKMIRLRKEMFVF